MTPAWIRCPHCEDFWCTLHDQHVFECPCPPIEDWTTDPYTSGDALAPIAPTLQALQTSYEALDEALRPAAVCSLVVDVPGGHVPVLLDAATRDAVAGALARNGLFVGFYNRSGRTPSALEFRPSWDWPEDERAAMGLPPKDRKLLTGVDLAHPDPVVERVGLGMLVPWRGGTHRAHVRIIAPSHVTHFAIGVHGEGILASGEFHTPLRVAKGGHVTLGLRLADLGVSRPVATRPDRWFGTGALALDRDALLREAKSLRPKELALRAPHDDDDPH